VLFRVHFVRVVAGKFCVVHKDPFVVPLP
jgi:hypothetical protein